MRSSQPEHDRSPHRSPGHQSGAKPDVISLIALNRSSPVPLYFQLAEAISLLIRDRALLPGDRLPAERDLAEIAGLSRMTARQALAQLHQTGEIEIRHGVGSFVAPRKVTHEAVRLAGFTEIAGQSGAIFSTKVLSLAAETIGGHPARALELEDGARAVNLLRVRLVDGTPLVLERSYLPAVRFWPLLHEDLSSQSLYRLLENRFSVQLTHADEAIESAIASEDEAEQLSVPAGSPILVLSGVAYSGKQPVECFRSVYRADRMRLSLQSTRNMMDAHGPPRISMVLVRE